MNLAQNKKNQNGFSLVELMVVVAIIGILTGIAVPRFQTFKARAVQTEGKTGLNGVFLAMQAYESNYSEWPVIGTVTNATAAGIGFALNGNAPKYAYTIISQNGATPGWAAKASSAAILANNNYDHLRISGNKWLCSPYDAVTSSAATASNTLSGTAKQCPQAGAATAAGFTLAIQTVADITGH
jgi:prepilin-type N-terminal cleavage/methylation domain-containing protein